MKLAILFIFLLNLSGCASWFLKKECNNTNWFNHGKGVAMRGARLNEDDFLNKCKKVEAEINFSELDKGFKKGMGEYCEPETAYETGRKGQKFAKDMCDVPGIKELIAKYQSGVRDYCQKDNGYSAGSSGEKYNYVCPAELEKSFLPEYKRGRKNYLGVIITQKQEEIQSLERGIGDLNMQVTQVNSKLSQLSRGDQVYIGRGGLAVQRGSNLTPEQITAEKNRLEGDRNSLQYQISAKRNQQGKLNNEISELRKEMAGL